MTGVDAAPRMRPAARTGFRVGFVVLLLLSAVLLIDYSVATAGASDAESTSVGSTAESDGSAGAVRSGETNGERTGENGTTAPRDAEVGTPAGPTGAETLTVVAEQVGPLKVFNRSGDVVYEYNRYERYWDIDSSPVGHRTLLYTATATAPPEECDGAVCKTNVVGRLNLTTGEHRELFERTYSNRGSVEWHDVDRVNETHVAVADIKHDRVFFVNIETDEVTWQWNASAHYPETVGGGPNDWTHLNDVEVLPDGSVMVSIRNMDEVIFIRPGYGVDEAWTLGSTGNHSILHAQHNPDYIPPARGGPALIVADSHNNRIVEYQRANGTWEQTWEWTDARAQWTRDGDRLPNGHTLVTDSNGGRVLEVTESGTVVWSVEATKPYEAERLGTGGESSTGESMTRLRLRRLDGRQDEGAQVSSIGSSPGQPRSVSVHAWQLFKERTPSYVLNSVLFVLSPWLEPAQLLPVAIVIAVAPLWGLCEFYWRYRPTIMLRGLEEAR